MNITNLTPHNIRLGHTTVRQGGSPVRINQNYEVLYVVHDIPVKLLTSTEADNLPPIVDDNIYIVSRLVADVYRDIREDFVFPYDFVKTSGGRILGCKSLARF